MRTETELPGVYVVHADTYAGGWGGLVELWDENAGIAVAVPWSASVEHGGPYDEAEAITEGLERVIRRRGPSEPDPDEWHDARFDREDA